MGISGAVQGWPFSGQGVEAAPKCRVPSCAQRHAAAQQQPTAPPRHQPTPHTTPPGVLTDARFDTTRPPHGSMVSGGRSGRAGRPRLCLSLPRIQRRAHTRPPFCFHPGSPDDTVTIRLECRRCGSLQIGFIFGVDFMLFSGWLANCVSIVRSQVRCVAWFFVCARCPSWVWTWTDWSRRGRAEDCNSRGTTADFQPLVFLTSDSTPRLVRPIICCLSLSSVRSRPWVCLGLCSCHEAFRRLVGT